MKPADRKEVEKALQKKGFKKNQADHRKFIYHTQEGKKTSVWTKTSHGSSHSEISKENLAKIVHKGTDKIVDNSLAICYLLR